MSNQKAVAAAENENRKKPSHEVVPACGDRAQKEAVAEADIDQILAAHLP